jgi:hypothetical protein
VTRRDMAARLAGQWLAILIVVSGIFVFVTFISFPLAGQGVSSRLLFWIGLAGENSVGAWWSGMLLLLAAFLAFDGFSNEHKAPLERRGWLALSGVLLILSFDEIGSLHEYLTNKSLAHIGVLALFLIVLNGYALIALYRGGARPRTMVLLLAAFALLGTVPIQEYIQHSREWPDPLLYGVRAAIEEGAEIAALLILVAATRDNAYRLVEQPARAPFTAAASYRRPMLLGAAILLPVLVAATFLLPYPAGPADWLASSLYFACALLVVRQLAERARPVGPRTLWLLAWFLVASVGSNAVHYTWDPEIFGTPISVRGLFLAFVLLTAVPVMRAAGRRPSPVLFGAALVTLVASRWSESQLLWWALPPLIAVWIYAIESKAAAAEQSRLQPQPPGVAVAS